MLHLLATRLAMPLCFVSVAAGFAHAQDCETLSGSARTDCLTGRARIYGGTSDIAASEARVRTSQERLRAVTGGVYQPKTHRAKSHRHKPAS